MRSPLANPATFPVADRFRLAVVFQITVIPPFRQVAGIPHPVLSFRSVPDFRSLRLILVVLSGAVTALTGKSWRKNQRAEEVTMKANKYEGQRLAGLSGPIIHRWPIDHKSHLKDGDAFKDFHRGAITRPTDEQRTVLLTPVVTLGFVAMLLLFLWFLVSIV
jgi:hypothetical protein